MFKQLTQTMFASPQIGVDEVEAARAQGFALIINNRPEGESEDQPAGAEIEAAARKAGMDYIAIPVTHSGFSESQVEAMARALDKAGDQPVLAYCRSGTRSTLLWGLARARQGANPQKLAAAAAQAGYDLTPVRPMMDMLAASAD